jgi:hypothetical protein
MTSGAGIHGDSSTIGEDCPRVVGRWGIQVRTLLRELLNGFDVRAFITTDRIEKRPEA